MLRGRLEGQAPEIDPQVYLTDCDPSAITPGDFLDVEVVGSRAYDLIARPASIEACSREERPLSGAESA